MKKYTIKKIAICLLLVGFCITFFCSCKKNEIEVGGKVKADVNLSNIIATASIKEDVFLRNDHINLVVGYGFWSSDIRQFLNDGKPLEMSIVCERFTVFDG